MDAEPVAGSDAFSPPDFVTPVEGFAHMEAPNGFSPCIPPPSLPGRTLLVANLAYRAIKRRVSIGSCWVLQADSLRGIELFQRLTVT